MYCLDTVLYDTLDEASKKSGIAKQTLESHINTTWKSRKGVEHTLEEIPDSSGETTCEPQSAAVEEPVDTLYLNKYDNKTLKRVIDTEPWLRPKKPNLGFASTYSAH